MPFMPYMRLGLAHIALAATHENLIHNQFWSSFTLNLEVNSLIIKLYALRTGSKIGQKRTSTIDFSQPHIKIIKGAIEVTSDWVLEDSVLYVLMKEGYKMGKSKRHGSYSVNLKFKDSARKDLQDLKKSGLY